jgi:hypothetical protein
MPYSQIIGIFLLLAIVGGITYGYVRVGADIKPDDTRRAEDWRRPKGGSS